MEYSVCIWEYFGFLKDIIKTNELIYEKLGRIYYFLGCLFLPWFIHKYLLFFSTLTLLCCYCVCVLYMHLCMWVDAPVESKIGC